MLKVLSVLKETELCGQQFAVYGTPQEPLFRAADVAKWIKHSDVSKMIQKVDDDEKGTNIVRTPGGNQEVWFLTEDGLYEVLMQSRKPIAKQFKKGVKQILKQIRQTGGYIATRQDDTPEQIMARAIIVAQDTIARKEHQIASLQQQNALQADQLKAQAPKVHYVDEVLQSHSTYCTNLIAKELGMSAKTLNQKLQAKGVIYKQGGTWVLHHKYQDKGYTKTRTHSFTRADGTIGTAMQTVYTERGRAFIHSIFS